MEQEEAQTNEGAGRTATTATALAGTATGEDVDQGGGNDGRTLRRNSRSRRRLMTGGCGAAAAWPAATHWDCI